MKYSVFFIITLASNVLLSMDRKVISLTNKALNPVVVTYIARNDNYKQEGLSAKGLYSSHKQETLKIGQQTTINCLPDTILAINSIQNGNQAHLFSVDAMGSHMVIASENQRLILK